MKILIPIFLVVTMLLACNNNDSSTAESKSQTEDSATIQDNAGNTAKSYTELMNNYLLVKNSLADDNASSAADAATGIQNSINKIEAGDLDSAGRKGFESVKLEILEHSNHIAGNKKDIAHQREHFDLLSQDILDLVTAMGSDRLLYKTYCPMYNDKKGATWLSETSEIRNPYYGKEMLTCGEVKEEIKQKR